MPELDSSALGRGGEREKDAVEDGQICWPVTAGGRREREGAGTKPQHSYFRKNNSSFFVKNGNKPVVIT